MTIRTIRLELLRHGRAANQLLSPLTPYLGVCGKTGVTSITIPYEHRVLLDRLNRICAPHGAGIAPSEAAARQRDLLDRTGEEITEILAANPGLVPQLHDGAHHDQGLMELQIVLSATELSLLPFEIAKVPDGCIGSPASWLAFQNKAPVCITRSTRSMMHPPLQWNRTPRILFIAAGVSDRLVIAHLRALLEALDPWLPEELRRNGSRPAGQSPSGQEIAEKLDRMLVLRNNASLQDIREVCAAGNFTHVHILAHGARNPAMPGEPVGISLKGCSGTGTEVISADCLASALSAGTHHRCNRSRTGLPLVVTLANCNIASAGDVVYSHGSFAHLLHDEGVPVVIGVQFPLSFAGSTRMTRTIYSHLLRGCDPRMALHEARRALFTSSSCGSCDWASLVGYISLPADFERQLRDYFYHRQIQVIENLLRSIDNNKNTKHCDQDEDKSDRYRTEALIRRLDKETARLPDHPCYAMEVLALKGTIAKRKAQMFHKINEKEESLRCLRQARRMYLQAAETAVGETGTDEVKKRSPHWSLTQFLVLQMILHGKLNEEDMEKWHAAVFAASVDMQAPHGSKIQIWAYASAMELNLLRAACDSHSRFAEQARQQARFIHDHSRDPFPVASSRRQLCRYLDWWSTILPAEGAGDDLSEAMKQSRARLRDLADELHQILDHG
ncbi:CHAT domain-containing protein [Thermodesulfobacteriota bacterium B35]